MAGSSEPAFSFEYKKGAIAPWMITHLFCNSPFRLQKLWITYTAGGVALRNGGININSNLALLQISAARPMVFIACLGDIHCIADNLRRFLYGSRTALRRNGIR